MFLGSLSSGHRLGVGTYVVKVQATNTNAAGETSVAGSLRFQLPHLLSVVWARIGSVGLRLRPYKF